jgi:hypothetical protein
VGQTIHSITSHGTLNALTDLSARVIDVQREQEGGQRAPLFDTIREMHPSPLLTIHFWACCSLWFESREKGASNFALAKYNILTLET